jgi:DNA-binding HxlR family transcriptional regulator
MVRNSQNAGDITMNDEALSTELLGPAKLESWLLPEVCASMELLDDVSSKWAVMTMAALSRGATRFNQLKRALPRITQKRLTQTLRRLERSGLISRTVLETSPIAVEYAVAPLGRTLAGPLSAWYRWADVYRSEVEAAQRRFDARTGKSQHVPPERGEYASAVKRRISP